MTENQPVGYRGPVLSRSDAEFLEKTAQWIRSDSPELADALPHVYDELRRLARSYLRRERADHTLQPTALVHEAYLRLQGQRNIEWQNRAQFFAMSAKFMRRILLDHAKGHRAAKRGGGEAARVSLDAALEVFERREFPALALNEALENLERIDPRQAQVVELRFFGGLNTDEISEVLQISPATVKRDWNFAKLWLERELSAA
jgi:RNA polymerase sigma factor (TIGR02999 family)